MARIAGRSVEEDALARSGKAVQSRHSAIVQSGGRVAASVRVLSEASALRMARVGPATTTTANPSGRSVRPVGLQPAATVQCPWPRDVVHRVLCRNTNYHIPRRRVSHARRLLLLMAPAAMGDLSGDSHLTRIEGCVKRPSKTHRRISGQSVSFPTEQAL